MRADGTTCCPRHAPIVTVGPGGTDLESCEGCPHTDGVDVETMVL